MAKNIGMEEPAIVRLGRRERKNWNGNAGRLRRGTARLATMRILAGRLRTRSGGVASCWVGMDRGFARSTGRGENVGAPTLKVILEGCGPAR
jgi:hypothetical protein